MGKTRMEYLYGEDSRLQVVRCLLLHHRVNDLQGVRLTDLRPYELCVCERRNLLRPPRLQAFHGEHGRASLFDRCTV